MATIKKWKGQLELFQKSLVSVSVSLYQYIIEEIMKKYKWQLRKINRKIIEEKLKNIPDMNDVVITCGKRVLVSVVINNFVFSGDGVVVEVDLVLPLYGEFAKLNKLTEEVAKEVGIFNTQGLKIKINLSGENLPISGQNPNSEVYGKSQKYFTMKNEVLESSSNKSSLSYV